MTASSHNAQAGEEAAKEVLSEVREALDKAELSLEYLIDKLKEELNATHQRVFFARGDKNHEAKVVYSDKLIDWQTRQKARMDAHRLRGDYPAEKWDITGNLPITVVSKIEREQKEGEFKDASSSPKDN
jgi:hypothetical protein